MMKHSQIGLFVEAHLPLYKLRLHYFRANLLEGGPTIPFMGDIVGQI